MEENIGSSEISSSAARGISLENGELTAAKS
jgi:hypothetical protein